jgi:hypothetical protein
MKDALDLTDGDVYAERILLDRKREFKRKAHESVPSEDQFFIQLAKDRKARGERLTPEEQQTLRDCLRRQVA